MTAEIDPRRQRDLEKLIAKLGLSLDLPPGIAIDWTQLHLALVDASSAEQNNQQLEFLGDAALRLAAAAFLLEAHPTMSVGEMAAVRSQLVSDRTLTGLADRYGLERYLQISSSAAGDRPGRPRRLADAMEAVLGALYLSVDDLSLIRPWLDPFFDHQTREIQQDPARQNYKAALQELTQAHYKSLPQYQVQELNQTHGDPERFAAEVWFQEQSWGKGNGPSIKQAEQAAARLAFGKLQAALEDGG
ncbi:ribonuclease III [Romeria aff. gracilis LEGE 07310]|uniref:Ribonuclease 3 n=1 Tax=Vasconcelosia minhoensis LEGE 07310 TaxID=915328 RepID=A0A8J7AMP3_9CYAN|nr:ribonuclease III [Romeria gracilis]MBE9077289.1 ribonuclease III [Romeria aff. gracilis LEGE 07310]